MGIVVLLMIALVLPSCSRGATEDTPSPTHESTPVRSQEPTWVVDPTNPGSDLPPTGRSLFDYIVTEEKGGKKQYAVPFPFTALVGKIEQYLGASSDASPLKQVLIPLNRSLQRNAAAPEFFKYPRAVLGVDTETPMQADAAGLFLKDRLFLGYQEKSGMIEVISYNEAAGRFEFQVVRDYRPGGNPVVVYANRILCTVCHQNQGPIFSRPLWDETNANPKIGMLLQAEGRTFYDFPVHVGVDVPNALDEATDRANEFAFYQRLWQDGCEQAGSPNLSPTLSMDCRADLLRFILQYRLTSARGFDSRSPRYTARFLPMFTKQWKDRWPKGVLIPNPDIMNRNAFDFLTVTGLQGMGQMQAVASADGRSRTIMRSLFEPSIPRGPLSSWSGGPEAAHRVVTGLSQFLAEVDIRRLDAHLFGRPGLPRQYEAVCRYESRKRGGAIERLTFQCHPPDRISPHAAGGFSMDGVVYLKPGQIETGTIDHLSFVGGDELADLEVAHGEATLNRRGLSGRFELTQKASALHARRSDGNAIQEMTFRMDVSDATGTVSHDTSLPGMATVRVADDFSAVHHAIDAIAQENRVGASDLLARKPFRRAGVMRALFEHLGMPPLTWCCLEDQKMPAVVLDVDQNKHALAGAHGEERTPPLKAFNRYCAECHHGEDRFPPNFLHGSPVQVQTNLSHCAERIFFRLGMWQLPPSERPETPMPPIGALQRLHLSPVQWSNHAGLRILKKYAADALQSSNGRAPQLWDFIAQGYDTLRDCLPPSNPVEQTAAERARAHPQAVDQTQMTQ